MATIAERLNEAAVTDTFLRNENPLSEGEIWKILPWAFRIGQTVEKEGWRANSTFAEGRDGGYFIEKVTPGEKEYAYTVLTIANQSTSSAERYFSVWCLASKTEESGYRVQCEVTGTNKYTIRLQKVTKGTAETLASVTNFSASATAGGKFGTIAIVAGKGKVYAYYKAPEGEWEQILEASDSTYTSGYGGMESKGNFFRGTNFKGWKTFSAGEEEKAPTAVTEPATDIKDDSAVLNCVVNAEGAATTYQFDWGLTTSYGNKAPFGSPASAGSEAGDKAYEVLLEGLEPNTTYHCRVVAINSKGEAKGSDVEFTTNEKEGKPVKVRIGGSAVEVNRWMKTSGGLVPV